MKPEDIQGDFKQLFYYINGFKRARTLHSEAKNGNNVSSREADSHELRMYQLFDSLELKARHLQRKILNGLDGGKPSPNVDDDEEGSEE